MAISASTRLGVYLITAPIGEGGMGQVYRARDTRLNRDVALKVLPDSFANDVDRLARFTREAQTLAALNHPNIAAIHGFEESDGITALVMELVDGEDLSQRIARGALPIDEAQVVATQIAEALEAAHEQGIIHRDLKPANIKVRPDGTVKVLDFGLAKAMEPAGPLSPDHSMSPTITTPAMTQAGMILGTAAYMSPEQARGRTVDRRADIWAFGCVLFEMLTGQRAFAGEDVTDTLAAVVRAEPDWSLLPKDISPTLLVFLRRCLQKDPRKRIGDIRDVRLALEGAFDVPAVPVIPAVVPLVSRTGIAWAVVGIVILTALVWVAFANFRSAPPAAEAIRFFISPPDTWSFQSQVDLTGVSPVPMAVSPDGRRVAFVAVREGNNAQLWVRSLDALTAQALAGTDGASSPFWSPDSRFLGFFAGGKLKKIDVAGGPPITLCDAPSGRGGSWSRDGIIVFNPANAVALQKVSAAGGTPTAATVLGSGEAGHRRPFFLPDGRHFLYGASVSGAAAEGLSIFVASLDSADRKLLLTADTNNAIYSRGHLLFLRETTLMAQPFDAERLELAGEAFPIAEQILRSQNAPPQNGFFSASENGVLAYQSGTGAGGSRLVWFDRSGKQLGVFGEPAAYNDIELSPDGKQVSVNLPDQSGRTRDIWLYDVARDLKTRFTFDPADELALIWSPDGSRTVFNSRRNGQLDLYQKASDGSGAETMLFEDTRTKYPVSWSADGRFILFVSTGPSGNDLFVLPLSGDRKPIPLLNTEFSEAPARFSSDGRWMVYGSNESGRTEVYVAPFPGPGGKRQVSLAGGTDPRWRRDGTEIFYISADSKLMAAAVNVRGANFEVSAVKPLFDARRAGPRYQYAVTADGQRFLINTPPEQAASAPITVVVNWTAGLTP